MRPTIDLGSIALQPQYLGADRLRRQGIAATIKDGLSANRRRQFLDFLSGARVDPVENGIHQRRAVRVDGEQARADRAGPDSPYVAGGDSGGADKFAA